MADRRLGARNPFAFMELHDVQELSNFFERRPRRTRSPCRAP
ncbi:hypothetical protein [Actinophytocola sp.]